MEQTIYFRVAKGDEPHKLTGFKDTDTDTTINLFFDGKCGGVYKWWRGNKEDEPGDVEDHGNSNRFSAEYKPPKQY